MSATVDKIRKLLNLATNASANANEAETARLLAERLMNAAGLTEADVAIKGEDPLATFGPQTMPSRESGWEGILAMAVARVCGCLVHLDWTPDNKRALTWVGTAAQRETAIELHAWLVVQVERLAEGARKIAKEHPTGARAYLGAYRRGLASSISQQAMRLVEYRSKEAPSDTQALQRRTVIERAIAAYEKEHKLRDVSASYRTRALGAYHAGVNDGRSVRLQHDVGGTRTKRLGSGS